MSVAPPSPPHLQRRVCVVAPHTLATRWRPKEKVRVVKEVPENLIGSPPFLPFQGEQGSVCAF